MYKIINEDELGGIIAPRYKSQLEEKLNKEGWVFCNNVNLGLFDENNGPLVFEPSFTEEILRKKYMAAGLYSDVRIEKAFDYFGKQLLGHRAIYAKYQGE